MKEDIDLAKWLSGEMNAPEKELFLASKDYELYEKIATYSKQFVIPDFDQNLMYGNVISTKKSKPVIALNKKWFAGIAATIVIGLGLTLFFAANFETTEIAQNGNKNVFQLPDDSKVTMNAGSEIKYSKWNWENKRSVDLNGEAFFEVKKGKTFDVNTILGKVSVVGTQFSVKNREQRFEVKCFEGVVKVQTKNVTMFVKKGESVTFENQKQIESLVQNSNQPEWLDFKYSFNSEPLTAVADELKRMYNVDVELKNIQTNQNFTGTIPTNNKEIALKIICSTFNLKSRIDLSNKKVIFTRD
jgi:transmembrane sensor